METRQVCNSILVNVQTSAIQYKMYVKSRTYEIVCPLSCFQIFTMDLIESKFQNNVK